MTDLGLSYFLHIRADEHHFHPTFCILGLKLPVTFLSFGLLVLG